LTFSIRRKIAMSATVDPTNRERETKIAHGAIKAAIRSLSDLPGPRGLPLVGNLLQIEIARLHKQCEAWARDYGPIYRLRLGPLNVIVVARNDLIVEMHRDRPDRWRRPKVFAEVIAEMGTSGLFSAEGADWQRQRRLMMAAFDPGHVKRFFPLLVESTERLQKLLSRAAHEEVPIDLQALLRRYTVDVTARLAFGIDMNTLEHPDHPLQGHLDQVFPKLMQRVTIPFPYWRWLKLPSDRALDRHLQQVHTAIRGFIATTRERIRSNPNLEDAPTNLLEAMIVARDEGGVGFDDQELIGQVFTVLLAGEDTTANSIAWALYLLHKRPQSWSQMVAEVDSALGEMTLPMDFEQTRNLLYVEAVINEAMRLRPVAPILALESVEDTTLADVAVPAGTRVYCLMRPGAVEPSLADDATDFVPDRWLSHDSADGRALRRVSLPFGAGPRTCPGRYLAMLEMKMVLAMIARDFDLVEVGASNGAEPRERLAFTMFPEDIRLRVKVRDRS
jgi:cytochrome P450